MTPRERVLAAFEYKPTDRVARFDNFWQYPREWEAALGPKEGLSDIEIRVPMEGAFATRARQIRVEGQWTYSIDEWGRELRRKADAYFAETLSVPIPPGVDPDGVTFDPPDLDMRYETPIDGVSGEAARGGDRCVFGKTGGPYLRTTYVRGEEQFLLDIAGDPPLAKALADKMADHLIQIAREQVRRWGLRETGVWIYDDMAYNEGPMFSPASFEQIFLPGYRRMVKEFRKAGARWVGLHSDGNIMPILEMLVDAGIDCLNPLEQRAGMNMEEIRRRHPTLVLTGGMDNTDTLVNGPIDRIEAEARAIIDMARDGGVVIGTHSISPEIPLEHFTAYHRTCLKYGAWGR